MLFHLVCSIDLCAWQIDTIMKIHTGWLVAMRFAMPALVRRLGEAKVMRLSMVLYPAVSATTSECGCYTPLALARPLKFQCR